MIDGSPSTLAAALAGRQKEMDKRVVRPLNPRQDDNKLIEDESKPPSLKLSCVSHIGEFQSALPGWWFSVGTCSLTQDASCGPDHTGPDAERRSRRDPRHFVATCHERSRAGPNGGTG